MARRPHLVWDWNGTLLDDLPLVVTATNAALTSAGGPKVTAQEHRAGFRRPIADYYAQVLRRPVGRSEFAVLNEVFHDAYQAGLPCELAVDAAVALRAWSGSQSLLSMWFHEELVAAVAEHGLASYFTRVDGLARQSAVLTHKHSHLVAHLAAVGAAGSEVVLIGDTVDDAHAAYAAGARCVLYEGGFTSAEQLRATGAPVVDSLLAAVTHARELVLRPPI